MAEARRPQQLRAKRTRRQLLLSARRVFAERGYQGATIDDVAQQAGCSKGAYYFHFASKDDILLALVDDWLAQRTRLLTQASSAQRARGDGAGNLIEALLVEERDEARLVFEFWAEAEHNQPVAERLQQAASAWRQLLVASLTRARDAGALPPGLSPDAAADLALALHRGLVVSACLAPDGARAIETGRTAIAYLTGTPQLRKVV